MTRKTLTVRGQRRRRGPEPPAPPPPTRDEEMERKDAEIARLRDQLAEVSQSFGQEAPSESIGVGGHQAVERVRDYDWPMFVRGVRMISEVFEKGGEDDARDYIDTVIPSLVHAFDTSAPRTGELVRNQHRTMMMLSHGEADGMMRTGRLGRQFQNLFIKQVELNFYEPCVRFLYAHGSETPAGIASIRG
jgi:hypothetical protein